MPELSESRLIRSLSEGKQQAYEEIFRLYWAKVYHYIYTVIGVSRAASVPDLAQNVFLKLWLHRESLPDIHSLDAWLFTISSNEARDFLRHEKVERKYSDDFRLSDEYIENLNLQYDYELISSTIAKCVEKMPPRRREIWRLSREEHLTSRQIAQKLGLSKRTVERHISLALNDIRTLLGHFVSGFLLFFISNWV